MRRRITRGFTARSEADMNPKRTRRVNWPSLDWPSLDWCCETHGQRAVSGDWRTSMITSVLAGLGQSDSIDLEKQSFFHFVARLDFLPDRPAIEFAPPPQAAIVAAQILPFVKRFLLSRTMTTLIVTSEPEDWPATIDDVEIVDATAYLTDTRFSEARNVKVFNLCRSYRYQSNGYYVSLLAEARGHKPLPSVRTIQDLKNSAVIRNVSSDLDELIESSLSHIRSDKFTLSVYFGRNLAKRYERLALHLFNQFQTPLLRAEFSNSSGRWILKKVSLLAASDVPNSHWPFVTDVAKKHFAGRGASRRKAETTRFDLAILVNPAEPQPPSDAAAIKKFVKAAASIGIATEIITRDDYGRLAEFDGLFIRETTAVNQHTYRFSTRAAREGLIVMDDPVSIVRCTNKVYLAEMLTRNKIATPKTIVAHSGNADRIGDELGFPCVLKKPDSAFSLGVIKVRDQQELDAALKTFLAESDLVVAQQFLPTTFDWRIGILDRQPLFASKYYMADGHWQIIKQDAQGDDRYGRFETIPVELAPAAATKAALKAANLVGDGLYGVDVKESNDKYYVIEVNDNPNIEAGIEDQVLKDELYRRIMMVFLNRMQRHKMGFAVTAS